MAKLSVSHIMTDPDLAVCCDQALSQKEAEKAALTEKLAALQLDLATAGMEHECIQREALSKQEQYKVKYGRVISSLVIFLALYTKLYVLECHGCPSI